MVKQKEIPQSVTNRSDKRVVRTQDVQQPPYPSWRFSTIDKGGSFRWPSDSETENQILKKLRHFDSMRWQEIEGSDHHAIGVDCLSKEARNRLAEIGQDDLEEVFSFHFSGKSRIIGIRKMNVIKLLWWDPEHKVCPSGKKHT